MAGICQWREGLYNRNDSADVAAMKHRIGSGDLEHTVLVFQPRQTHLSLHGGV